jgi:hypothetical protein
MTIAHGVLPKGSTMARCGNRVICRSLILPRSGIRLDLAKLTKRQCILHRGA